MGFQAYDVALEIGRQMKPLRAVLKTRDRDLEDQAYRAMKSIVSNTGEGGRRLGKDRSYHFAISAGSAQELRAALQFAEAYDLLTAAQIEPVMTRIDRELAMLWRLTHPKPSVTTA